uniref:Uncharacterized protein n=1 Tax=Rhizophora mucronata TaxID=61149 RepID=A0A2P2QE05_RHIMU
MIVFLWLKEQ